MKFAKKILVGIIAASLLTCCFMLSTSAEPTPIEADDLAEVYEYFRPIHYSESFEDELADGETVKAITSMSAFKTTAVTFTTASRGKNGITELIKRDDGNTAIKVSYTGTGSSTCSFYSLTSATSTYGTPEQIIITFRVMVAGQDDEGNPISGSKIEFKCYDNVMLTLDFSNRESTSASYMLYDKSLDNPFTLVPIEGAAPAFDTWYSVQGVFDYKSGKYSVSVTNESDENGSFGVFDQNIGTYELKKSCRVAVSDSVEKAITWLDDVYFYEGAQVRDILKTTETIETYIMQAGAIAASETSTMEDRKAVADFYVKVFNEFGYAPVEGSANFDSIKAIYDSREAFFNTAYTEVLQFYADALDAGSFVGYRARVDACEYVANVEAHYPNDRAEILQLPGITESMADLILASKAKIAAANVLNERIKQDSDRYVTLIAGFDFSTNDYQKIYNLVSALADCKNIDPTYKYVEENGITEEELGYEYTVLSLAIEKHYEIATLFSEINANVEAFVGAVTAMPDPTAPGFDVTVNFAETYANFLTASGVYKNGTLHERLEIATHPNAAEILALMDKLEAISVPVNGVKDTCEQFITLVIQAMNASSYKYRLEAIQAAAEYMDVVLDDYAGVSKAKSDYAAISSQLNADMAAATAYKNAVAAINIEASYPELKSAVSVAFELKASGNVIGIDGVSEANEIFARAEAKITALEGNSSTLISAVNALTAATSFAERRELIAIANGAKDGAEDSISGVSEAKTKLATEISKLESEIAAINAAFANTVSGALDVAAAVAPTASVYKSASIVEDFLN